MEEDKEELKDTLARIKATFLLREGSLVLFLSTVVLLKAVGLFSFFAHTDRVIFCLAIWLASSIVFRYSVQRQKTSAAINNLYFFYDILLELPIMFLIVYSIGGVEWMGAMFFLFPIVFTNIFFSKKRAILVSTGASICYVLLVLLPYFNLIPFSPYFQLGIKLYQNTNYVLINILFTVSTFYLIGLISNITTDLLKKRTVELVRTKKELEEERGVLEIKVENRTKELEEERASLKEKVEDRTTELQKRIKELEILQKLTVNRELKMVELKKEMEGYKKEIDRFKQDK